MSYAIVYGTRPELIKLRSVIGLMPDAYLIHVGQHKSREMMGIFQEQLGVRSPNKFVDIDNDYQTGRLIEKLGGIIHDAARVICQGDTNTALASAFASRACIHIEAGLRCGSRMIEEQNRIIIDHLAVSRFAPTKYAVDNLLAEGLDCVFSDGNTGIDTFLHYWRGKKKPEHYLLTLHRPENVDCEHRLDQILADVNKYSDLPVIWPVHPRAKTVRSYKNIEYLQPVNYFKMLDLLSKSARVFTDSGGLQEEACAAGVPCVTIRESTERPETVAVGANIVVGLNIQSGFSHVFPLAWDTSIYGNGQVSQKIVAYLTPPVATQTT